MNIKLKINKTIAGGFWKKFLVFLILNIVVLGLFLFLYECTGGVKNPDGMGEESIGPWEAILIFTKSNSMLAHKTISIPLLILLTMDIVGAVLFTGLIISIITSWFHEKIQAIKEGHIHYKLNNHIVIIGYDRIVPSIIKKIINDKVYHKDSVIVLQTCDDIESVRHALQVKLASVDLKRVVLIHAPRQSFEELGRLYTTQAKEIFVVGDRTESDHDAENMHTFEMLVKIHSIRACANVIPMTMWFENEASYAALQLNDVSSEWLKYFEFRPYNFYKRWANRLLTNSTYRHGTAQFIYPELDHEGIQKDSTKSVHLIVVGMNRMGIALAKEAAHLLHFPNFTGDEEKNYDKTDIEVRRTRITFIDDHADVEMNFFTGRLPGYFEIAPMKYLDLTKAVLGPEDGYEWTIKGGKANFLDVQFEFIKGRVESPSVREWIKSELKQEEQIITIAICLEDSSKSLGMALYLPEEVYLRGRNNHEAPWRVEDESQIVNIFVRQEETGSLIKAFGDAARDKESQNKRYANIYPFGMVDDSFALEYYSNHLAMAFNYIYEYYFKYSNTLPSSIPAWEELKKDFVKIPTSHQWSNLYLADSIEFKLRSVGLTIEDAKYANLTEEMVDPLAKTEHNRWNMEKLLLGYRAQREYEKKYSKAKKNILKNNFFAHKLIIPNPELTADDVQLDKNIIVKLPDILRMLNK